jgi:hypothetical protein
LFQASRRKLFENPKHANSPIKTANATAYSRTHIFSNSPMATNQSCPAAAILPDFGEASKFCRTWFGQHSNALVPTIGPDMTNRCDFRRGKDTQRTCACTRPRLGSLRRLHQSFDLQNRIIITVCVRRILSDKAGNCRQQSRSPGPRS